MPNLNYNYNYPYPNYPQPQTANLTQNTQNPQNGGFVSIPSAEMVYSYPVAMGNCVTFKVEGKPIVMEKSMGFSQFDAPRIKKYRLVEETDTDKVESEAGVDLSEIEKIKSDIKDIWEEISEIKESPKKNAPKRESKDGES